MDVRTFTTIDLSIYSEQEKSFDNSFNEIEEIDQDTVDGYFSALETYYKLYREGKPLIKRLISPLLQSSQEVLVEMGNIMASKYPKGTCVFVDKTNIKSKRSRFEIASEVAKTSGKILSKHIEIFEIRDQKKLLELAALAIENNIKSIDYLTNFARKSDSKHYPLLIQLVFSQYRNESVRLLKCPGFKKYQKIFTENSFVDFDERYSPFSNLGMKIAPLFNEVIFPMCINYDNCAAFREDVTYLKPALEQIMDYNMPSERSELITHLFNSFYIKNSSSLNQNNENISYGSRTEKRNLLLRILEENCDQNDVQKCLTIMLLASIPKMNYDTITQLLQALNTPKDLFRRNRFNCRLLALIKCKKLESDVKIALLYLLAGNPVKDTEEGLLSIETIIKMDRAEELQVVPKSLDSLRMLIKNLA